MSLLPDFDLLNCIGVGIVLVVCFVVYYALKEKISEFADDVEEEAGKEYKILEDAEYGTFVEQEHPHPLDDSKGYFCSGFVPMNNQGIIGIDMAKGKDISAAMVVVEKAYLEWAGEMLDEYGRLKGLWNELASYMFDHLDMDGGTFQDLGVKHGLLIEAAYDPEVHGDIDTEVGDTIFINPLQEDDNATADDKD